MCRILRKSPIVILVSLLLASILCPLGVGNSHHPASAASVVSSDGWGVVHNMPAGQWVRNVWGSSSSDIFAVGNYATIHFDGHTWSSTNNITAQALLNVWGSSGSDVWAVGANGAIVHYDGNAWSDWSLTSAPDPKEPRPDFAGHLPRARNLAVQPVPETLEKGWSETTLEAHAQAVKTINDRFLITLPNESSR